jgi:hypothetical protein
VLLWRPRGCCFHLEAGRSGFWIPGLPTGLTRLVLKLRFSPVARDNRYSEYNESLSLGHMIFFY